MKFAAPITARPITARPVAARGVSAGKLPEIYRELFGNGEKGVFYLPSDFSTMWQDDAGTTPVTALGQPVGRILDLSGNGNHATQSTPTSRPTIEARVNLATNTGFSLGGVGSLPTGWIERGLVTGRVVVSDSSSGYALRVTGNGISSGVASTDDARIAVAGWGAAGTSTTLKFKVRKASGSGAGSAVFVWAGGPAQSVTTTDHWVEVSYTRVTGNTSHVLFFGSNVAGVVYDIADVSLTLTSDAARPYQRVNTATNYTDIGAPRYLAFDGTDDGLVTPSIDFTGTDSMTVIAGARKNSDATRGSIVELGAVLTAGSFFIDSSYDGSTTGALFGGLSVGSGVSIGSTLRSNASGVAAPFSAVLSLLSDISNDYTVLRVNGAAATPSTVDQGTGNYKNAALYIGRRGGTTLPFNGRLYGLVVCGADKSSSVARFESWMNQRMGGIY